MRFRIVEGRSIARASRRLMKRVPRALGQIGVTGVLFVAANRPVLAQADRVETGSFTVFEKGARIGREQFSMRRAPSPDGTAFELRSESTFGERRTALQLSVDSLGSPVHYALEIRDGTNVDVRAGGQRVRGRFATLARKSTGETAREFMLGDRVFVLEPGFFHQYSPLLRGRRTPADSLAITAVSVLDGRRDRLKLVAESMSDTIVVAGVRTVASRWRLEGSGSAPRILWGDREGRLLRVLIPSLSIEAVRDEHPK